LGGGAIISQSFAAGAVQSQRSAGGLVALNEGGAISDSYAVGAVSGPDAGGLMAQNSSTEPGTVSRSYSSGTVSGNSGETGGFVGYDQFTGTIKHAYWDTTTSGITNLSQGAGNVSNDPGIKGLSNTQFQSGLPRGFATKIWAEDPAINNGLPYLLANPPPN
jgi:hypothetical protein